MSTGFPLLQCGGRKVSSFFRVSFDSFVILPPFSITASVARTPGPPALVTMAMFGPVGLGCFARMDEQLNRSTISFTLTIPARLNAAS